MTYGSGAIMAVPAHDTRDFEFATKFGLEIIQVIENKDSNELPMVEKNNCTIINSEFLNGLNVEDATEKIIKFLEDKGIGEKKTNYKLRDWVFSRQRYWGEPIPIIHCDKCGYVPMDEKDLPLRLPEVDNYEPSHDGESPLSHMDSFVNTTCPVCGGPAKRETDTMPQWAGSSWYFLRYIDPHNHEALADPELLEHFLQVDWYNGGMEHTTLHLLYSRFWHRFLYDIGVVPTKEPYKKRTSHGMILGSNSEKMSKSRGNVINPDDIVNEYGADTLRTYEMFMGDFEKAAPWSTNGVKGARRFLERVYGLTEILNEEDGYSKKLESSIHKTIKKVSDDYETLKFNTAIAALMSLVNEFYAEGSITKLDYETLLILLNPVAPHITEELYHEVLGGYLNEANWPEYDEEMLVDDEVEIPVQFNGKVRFKIIVPIDATEEEVFEKAESCDEFKNWVEDKKIVKKIYIKGKILNIVIK